MTKRAIQNIIDILRQKKLKDRYQDLEFIAQYFCTADFVDNKILEKIKRHKNKFYSRLLYNFDKQLLQKEVDKVDSTKIPPIIGSLRQYQIRLAEFSKNLIAELEKAGFHPCLTDGSLLGAVRHGGFIPWDDDMDFELMRDEFERLKEFAKRNYIYFDSTDYKNYDECKAKIDTLLKENPGKIIFSQKISCLSAHMGTSYEDILYIDFLPRDYINPNVSQKDYDKYHNKKIKSYQNLNSFKEKFGFFEKELENQNIYVNDSENTAFGWGNCDFLEYNKTFYLKKEEIMPYKRINFEGTQYYIINSYHKYLEMSFGNYMHIPADCTVAHLIKLHDNWLKRQKRRYIVQFK